MKHKNNWNIGPFIRWWDKKKEEKGFDQLTKIQAAYTAWEAAIDYKEANDKT